MKETKSEEIHIRLSPTEKKRIEEQEKKRIEEKAALVNKSVASYLTEPDMFAVFSKNVQGENLNGQYNIAYKEGDQAVIDSVLKKPAGRKRKKYICADKNLTSSL